MQTIIEVFKTSVLKTEDTHMLVTLLKSHFPNCRINFDLNDCDKVMRVEGKYFEPGKIALLLQDYGFICEVLD